MKGTMISEIPERKYHNLRRFLDEFMRADAKYYKVEFAEGEYKSTYAGYRSLYTSIQRGHYPIKASFVDGNVYLARTDM